MTDPPTHGPTCSSSTATVTPTTAARPFEDDFSPPAEPALLSGLWPHRVGPNNRPLPCPATRFLWRSHQSKPGGQARAGGPHPAGPPRSKSFFFFFSFLPGALLDHRTAKAVSLASWSRAGDARGSGRTMTASAGRCFFSQTPLRWPVVKKLEPQASEGATGPATNTAAIRSGWNRLASSATPDQRPCWRREHCPAGSSGANRPSATRCGPQDLSP